MRRHRDIRGELPAEAPPRLARSAASSAARTAAFAVALATLATRPAGAGVRADAAHSVTRRLATVDETDAVLADKRDHREDRLRRRVRALYKLARAGHARLWVDPRERTRGVRRRAAARRLLRRDVRELDLLDRERAEVAGARSALVRALGEVAVAPVPAPRSLHRPVRGDIAGRFGRYRDRELGVGLVRRGVELRARAGELAGAVAGGRVRYAGPVRGLGRGAVVEHHGGLVSVTARLGELAVAAGDDIARGQPLGRAAGSRIHLQMRLPVGPAAFPVDPAPLLSPPKK